MFWLQNKQVLINQLWEHVDFQVFATFDIIAAPGWRSERDKQNWNELWLIREGRCEIVQGERRVMATAGDAVLLQTACSRLTSNPDDSPLSIIGFTCTVRLAGGIDFLALLGLPLRMRPNRERLLELLERMADESQEQGVGYTFALHGLAQMALVEVLRAESEFRSQRTALEAGEKMEARLSPEVIDVLHFVAANFERDIEVSELAEIAHLSAKHFSRKFKHAVGLSPMEYIRHYRLQQSTQRLAATEEPIALIAAKCGFADTTQFSRAFKAHFKVTPTTYKQNFRAMKIQS